jgi:DNA-directed RNA polymerase II subunit RPB2
LKNKELIWKNLIADITLNTNDSKKFESIIEYVDVEEHNTLMIASVLSDLKKGKKGERLQLRYTHMEIHPSLILGVLASNIPFSNHNQAPRNTYQSAMGKQAIGLYATNFKTRLDTLSHVLNYPQQPLVKTNMSTLLNLSNMPCGTNVIVAIATYTGYNQEDSIILNRSSVQRGLFTSTFYRTLKEQCNKNLSTGEEEIFCNPKNMESFVNKPQNYNKINDDGFVSENTFVEAGDVLIGKCMPQKTSTSFFHKDNSVTMKNNEIGYIDLSCTNDKYFKNTSADGYSFCKIKIRSFREPTIGDKLSSNHAQKGSIGIMYNQEDLPYTKDGLVPDIIINPHAIPSRMTIAQLIETIMGKACATLGTVGNATPFTSVGVNDICNILGNECNLEPHGNQLMYNSRTGEQMKTSIFVGPTYYQRLKHMVCDKIHSRNSNGPVVLLTRQPAEGRARDGGLRLGEMEVECNWGHGTMNFLKERFIDCSDNYRIFTCKKCGNIANVNPNQNIYICNLCNNKTNFAEIRIPFASKLLFQEIQSMGINTKFYT